MSERVDPQIHPLIDELTSSRNRLEKYADDLDTMQEAASSIFPKKFDARQMHFLDDKLKVISSFYQTILSMRQEINRLIVHEIEIRRKITKDGDLKGGDVDIRKLVEKLDKQGYKFEIIKKEADELGLDTLDLETKSDE